MACIPCPSLCSSSSQVQQACSDLMSHALEGHADKSHLSHLNDILHSHFHTTCIMLVLVVYKLPTIQRANIKLGNSIKITPELLECKDWLYIQRGSLKLSFYCGQNVLWSGLRDCSHEYRAGKNGSTNGCDILSGKHKPLHQQNGAYMSNGVICLCKYINEWAGEYEF